MKKYTLLMLTILTATSLLGACSPKKSSDDNKTTTSTSTTTTSSTTTSSQETSASTSEGSTSTEDPTTTPNTGIKLESGQVTIDYAISILGDKEWVVIEDNYNRTDNNPFNLLQGNDGSLYRVYQNGVIKDIEDNVVHQP